MMGFLFLLYNCVHTNWPLTRWIRLYPRQGSTYQEYYSWGMSFSHDSNVLQRECVFLNWRDNTQANTFACLNAKVDWNKQATWTSQVSDYSRESSEKVFLGKWFSNCTHASRTGGWGIITGSLSGHIQSKVACVAQWLLKTHRVPQRALWAGTSLESVGGYKAKGIMHTL